MINPEELASCRKRGHDVNLTYADGREQYPLCQYWVRMVRAVEERENEPPYAEMDTLTKTRRDPGRVHEGLDRVEKKRLPMPRSVR